MRIITTKLNVCLKYSVKRDSYIYIYIYIYIYNVKVTVSNHNNYQYNAVHTYISHRGVVFRVAHNIVTT